MGRKYISWRRVSTFRQSKSGLGLEAQKEIIRYFIERENGEWLADYSECYTGTELSGCVELQKAMQHAKKENAVLVIAKTDRFRNTIEALKVYEEMGDGNIMFCDLPHTDKFTLTLFFALAEREALIVSIRTKQALAVKKSQGIKLGAASVNYQLKYKLKSQEERKEIEMKRGECKRLRFQENKETKAFVRILRNVFPDATNDENPAKWDWKMINCKQANKVRMLNLMKDYHDTDTDLFRKWDFDCDFSENNDTAKKLRGKVDTFKKSFLYN